MQRPRTLTTTEVARLLRVSVATLHNWKRSGKLVPASTCGRGYSVYTRGQVMLFQGVQAQLQSAQIMEEESMDAAAAAKALGIPVTRLRSLDRTGRFVPAARSASNRRLYTEQQVQEIRGYLAAGSMPPGIAARTITRHAAAELLGVCVRTLQLWEREKKLIPLARWETQSLYTTAQVLEYKERWLTATASTRHISRPGQRRV